MSGHAAPRRLVSVLTIVLFAVGTAAALTAGCGSAGESTIPTFSATATAGPKTSEATVRVTSDGSGTASAAIVLTYPDGHRSLLSTGQWRAMDSGTATRSDLPAGVYTFTVYAIPAGNQDSPEISVGYFVDRYAVATATVTVP
jgi:predicted phage tail protein